MTNNSRRNVAIGVGILTFILCMALFYLPGKEVNGPTPSNPELELLAGSELKVDGGLVTVDGQVKNNTEYTYEDVEIKFDLIDDNGETVGEATALIDHLYGNNTWTFSAFQFFPIDMGIESFELNSLEGNKTNEIVDIDDIEFYEGGEMIEGMTVDEYNELSE